MYGYPNATQEEKHQIKFFYSELKEGRQTKLNQSSIEGIKKCNSAIKDLRKDLKELQTICKRRSNG